MKREFITNLLPDIDKAVLDQIMAEHGKDIEGQKKLVASLTTERDTLHTQLEQAGETIKGFEKLDVDGIKTKAAEWETKYNTDTQALKDQLAAKEYEYSVNGAVAGLKFTSESARKAFVADLTGKQLPVQEGKLLGFEDFVKTYKESDPHAFAPEDDGEPAPHVVSKTSGGNTGGAGAVLRAAFGLPTSEKEL